MPYSLKVLINTNIIQFSTFPDNEFIFNSCQISSILQKCSQNCMLCSSNWVSNSERQRENNDPPKSTKQSAITNTCIIWPKEQIYPCTRCTWMHYLLQCFSITVYVMRDSGRNYPINRSRSGSRVANSQFHLPVLRQPGRALGCLLRELLPLGSPLRRVTGLICNGVRRHPWRVNGNVRPERRGVEVYFDVGVWSEQRVRWHKIVGELAVLRSGRMRLRLRLLGVQVWVHQRPEERGRNEE